MKSDIEISWYTIMFSKLITTKYKLHDGVAASAAEGPGFGSRSGRSVCVEFAAWLSYGFSGFLPKSKDMQFSLRLIRLKIAPNMLI